MEKNFLTAEDVVGLLGCKKTMAYSIIKRLNKELEKAGFITIRGRVSARYFEQRMMI